MLPKTTHQQKTNREVQKKVRHVLMVEGTVNFLVLIAKVFVGMWTGSSAIMSDALHSLADVANNIVALIVSKLSTNPPDVDHPYGHRKFETLAVFILATLLCVMAIEVLLRAIETRGQAIHDSTWGLVTMVGVLFLNICLAGWENYWSRKLDSTLLRADAHHTFSDAFTTIAVIAGWQLAARGYDIMDTIFAVLVSLLVFYLAFDLYRRAVPILVDQVAITPEKVAKSIRTVPGVISVRQVRSRWVESEIFADVIISVDPHLSTEKSHQIADEIEAILAKTLGIHDVTIHIEPGKRPVIPNNL